MKQDGKKLAYEIFLIALCVVSFFWFSKLFTRQAFVKQSVDTINEKQANVTALTGISIGSSFAVSLLPNNAGQAISEKLADLSGYLLLITIALYVGKWLIAIMGTVAFRVIIPIGCILLLMDSFFGIPALKKISWKVIVFALILFFLVPTSTWISNRIDDVSDASIAERVEQLDGDSSEIVTDTTETTGNETLKDKLNNLWSKVTGGVTGVLKKFQLLLQNLIDTIAAMIVTSVVIPIGVLAIAIWVTNMIFKTSFSIPDMGKARKKAKAAFAGADDKEFDEIVDVSTSEFESKEKSGSRLFQRKGKHDLSEESETTEENFSEKK